MIKINEKNVVLTYLDTLIAIQKFLDIYFFESYSGNIATLLGDIQIHSEWKTVDTAAWEDLLDAINEVMGNPPNEPGVAHSMIEYGCKTFTSFQAFNAMRKFVNAYSERISSTELPPFLDELTITETGEVKNPIQWQRWVQCVNETLQDEQIHFMHLFNKKPDQLKE